MDHSVIDTICNEISLVLGDTRIFFQTVGEKKPWEDLRVSHFVLAHKDWDESMGPWPTFGCYSQSSISDAILDIRLGRIARWVMETTTAINLCKELAFSDEVERRIQGVLKSKPVENAFEAALLCAIFTEGNMRLSKAAWEHGEFFSFKLDPGSRFSDEVLALFIHRESVGFYKNWGHPDAKAIAVGCSSKMDLIAHARLNQCQRAAEPGVEVDATAKLLKKAWGF